MLSFIDHLRETGKIGYCPACIYSRGEPGQEEPMECIKNSPRPVMKPVTPFAHEPLNFPEWPSVWEGDSCGDGIFDESFDYD